VFVDDLTYSQWPVGFSRPTEDEMEEAKRRWMEEVGLMYKNGYGGDFGSSLEFAMATYSICLWSRYFDRLSGI
jgi:hypothetical protein